MAKVPAARINFRIPVVSEFHRRIGALRRCDKHQREASLFIDVPALLHKAKLVDEEIQRRVEIGDTDHGMQIFHGNLMGWSEPERACLAVPGAKVRNESLAWRCQFCQISRLAIKI